jgi:hypothetical protein
MLIGYKMMQDHQLIDSLLVKQLLDKMYVVKDDVFFTSTLIFFVSLKDFHDHEQLL